MWLNLQKGELDDPKGICRDVSQTGHWGNGIMKLQFKQTKIRIYFEFNKTSYKEE